MDAPAAKAMHEIANTGANTHSDHPRHKPISVTMPRTTPTLKQTKRINR